MLNRIKNLILPNSYVSLSDPIGSIRSKKHNSGQPKINDEGSIQLVSAAEVQSQFTPDILHVLTAAPVLMLPPERLLLLTLIFATRPKRYLEIGTFQGGSAALVCAAMDAAAIEGTITCVDPEPKIEPELWNTIQHRTSKLVGYSPQILPQAQQSAGGKFDFVLIDGDHSYKGALRDAEGAFSVALPNAYVLFHDSFFPEVKHAIDDFVSSHANQVVDFGLLTREYSTELQPDGTQRKWGGLRMLKVCTQ